MSDKPEPIIYVQENEDGETRDRQVFQDYEISRIIQTFCCAKCWGTLIAQPAALGWFVVFCPDCGDGYGFHSRHFAAARHLWSHWDYQDAFDNLHEVLGLEKKPFNEKQTLKDLGF